jgi:lycopene beta-cyclase
VLRILLKKIIAKNSFELNRNSKLKTHTLAIAANKYDYIITGAGCAGLSLLMQMIRSGKFRDKKILLLDKADKQINDRTWCFWEKETGLFEEIVYHNWDTVWFHDAGFSKELLLAPYSYKLIRGIDFYKYCFETISHHPNIHITKGNVEKLHSDANETYVIADGEKITAQYIFNSILFERPALRKKDYYLLQHFKGWVIETPDPVFDPTKATLMDFRVNQEQGTTFVYVMPFSATRALVEYTLFTKQLINEHLYEEGLRQYIDQFIRPSSYTITEEEYGIIPMTNYRFPTHENNIIHIGTAGGQTKASSGYTFRFIQKHSAAIVEQLIAGQSPVIKNAQKRFRFYDSTLLHILENNKLPGHEIFTALFKKNKPQQVLRFLDNESSIGDELKIITSLPTMPFLKAAILR